MALKYDICVIICCFNSASRIRPTLECLLNQITDDILTWQIIVVDNNSVDNTSQIVTDLWKSFNSKISLTVITERKPGLSHARKKGFDSSNAEFIIYCDDDNWLDDRYLQIAYGIMSENHSIGMLGGIGEEIIENSKTKPEWFDYYRGMYAVGPQSSREGDITFQKGYVYGAGAVIRKSVLMNIYNKGFVSQLSDRVGKTLVSGGDNEIGYMISLSGFKIYYSSRLKFKHYIPLSRLKISYLTGLIKGQQLTLYKIKYYESCLFNKKFLFPNNRFTTNSGSTIKLGKSLYHYFARKISYVSFRLNFSKNLHEKIFLLLYYNNFKNDIISVEKNTSIFKDVRR